MQKCANFEDRMKDKETIKLTLEEGAIIIRENGEPEIYAPIGTGEYCDSVRFTLAFLLFAVEKDEWVEEFSGFIDTVQGKYNELNADARRSQFKVIDGEREE